MIADKADALIVPVRIEGAERSPLGYLRPTQIRKALFPRIKVTFLPPRKLAVDPALKGKARRQAAGLALQDIMVDAAVETARFDRTLFDALVDARETRDTEPVGAQRPARVQAQLPQADNRHAGARGQARGSGAGAGRRRCRADAAELGRRRRRLLRPAGHRPRAGHDQLHQRCRQHQGRLPRRGRRGDPDLARVRHEGSPDRSRRRVGQGFARHLSRGCARDRRLPRQGRRHPRRRHGPRRPQARRSSRHSLHLGLRGRAEGRRALAHEHARQLRPVPHAHRRQRRGHRLQRTARVPFVRAHRRPDHAAARRRAGLSLPFAAALPHRAGAHLRHAPPPSCSAPTRSCAATRAPPTPTTSARCA